VIILASASPRRAQLLVAAGIAFDTVPANVDETPVAGESPTAYVERLALEKARAAVRSHPGRTALGADTTVVLDGHLLGKPVDAADAAAMLARLSGHAHEVLTGVALVGPRGEQVTSAMTRVWVSRMTSEDMAGYVETGEGGDKAGAYAIQGRFSRFIERIEGSYSNVVGLPVALVCDLLMRYPDGGEKAGGGIEVPACEPGGTWRT
jgi:septum formation protein